jgi:hypothetical protein
MALQRRRAMPPGKGAAQRNMATPAGKQVLWYSGARLGHVVFSLPQRLQIRFPITLEDMTWLPVSVASRDSPSD